MTKKEVSEIKKLFNITNCSISKIAGCYVDGEKEKKAVFSDAFLSLPEETVFKYLEIFKKGVSGTIGKNLFNLEFPLAEEAEGGAQEFFYQLVKSRLKDNELLEQFYDKVIESYNYTGNYLILLAYNDYDIPGKAEDGMMMDDASDEVYSHILCTICPVDLSKPGLSYHEQSGDFKERSRDWVAGVPEISFLYPAFNDRSTDIHAALYHTKNPAKIHDEFVDNVMGCRIAGTCEDQKQSFVAVVEESLGEHRTFDHIKDVLSEIDDLADEAMDQPEPCVLGKSSMLNILGKHLDDDKAFQDIWKEASDATGDILVDNVATKGSHSIKMEHAEIKTKDEFIESMEVKTIDGRKCLVIPIEGGMLVNGIAVSE